jgi:hypothetical protein
MVKTCSRTHKYTIYAFLFLLFLCQGVANADHLPEKLLADGKPETTLAGINLRNTKLNDVIRMYGPPTRKVKAPNNPAWTGYVWELPNAKLEVGVNSDASGAQIDDIYVEGTADGQLGSTGRGLKLGDGIKTIKRIYGRHFQLTQLRNKPKKRMEFTGVSVANQRVTIQWNSEEFTLTAGISSNGKVVAMWLILPECYPGDCE